MRGSKAALNGPICVLAGVLKEHNVLVNAPWRGSSRPACRTARPLILPEEAASTMLWLTILPYGGPTDRLFHGDDRLSW